MTLPPYPQMKDSHIGWIGQVPAHWEMKNLKHLATFQSGDNITGLSIEEDGEYPVYGGNGLRGFTDAYTHDGEFVLIGRQGALCGNINYASGRFWASEHAVVVTPRTGVRLRWLGELLRSMNLGQHSVSAAQPGLSVEFVVNLRAAVPPVEEQDVIVAFLDCKTVEIDAVIAAKERIIGLLQEKRQALITRAVARGLDPSVPMKDSGVEWLGPVPAHWQTKRLKHISPRIGVGLVINPSHYVADEGVPFLFGADISPGKIHAESARRMSEKDSRSLPQSRLYADDLVTVRVGYPGVTAIVPPELEGANCASVMVTRRHSSFCSQWLCYAINSRLGSDQINAVKYGAAQEQFNIAHAVEFMFPVPPLHEQRQIVKICNTENDRVDRVAALLTEQIATFREYRQTLTSAAVTGKINLTREVTSAGDSSFSAGRFAAPEQRRIVE